MTLRRLFLVTCLLLLAAPIASASQSVPRTGGGSAVYLPLLNRSSDPSLANIVGVGYSWFPYSGPHDQEVYVASADGRHVAALSDNAYHDDLITWSHDGWYVAWHQTDFTWPPKHDEAWISRSDGANAHPLPVPRSLRQLAWSPSENRLLLLTYDESSPVSNPQYSLYVTTAEAYSPTLVVGLAKVAGMQWSPKGSYLSYQVEQGGSTALYVAQPDGSQAIPVAVGCGGNVLWSPDEAWLACVAGKAGAYELWLVRSDGRDAHSVDASPRYLSPAAWVKGGAGLLIERGLDEVNNTSAVDLYSVSDNTSRPFLSSAAPTLFRIRGVSPDGQQVVYTEEEEDFNTLKLRRVDGGPAKPLSPQEPWTSSFDFGGWSSDGRQVAYAHIIYASTSGFSSELFVADVDRAEPVYRKLDEHVDDPQWLPGASWFSVYAPYQSTRLYNSHTGDQINLPRSAEGEPVFVGSWRVAPPVPWQPAP